MEIRIFRINSKLVEFAWQPSITDQIFEDQLRFKRFLEQEYKAGIKEIRIGFHTLSLRLRLDMSIQDANDILTEYHEVPKSLSFLEKESLIWTLPICYDPGYGFDLSSLSKMHNLDIEEIIQLHSAPTYRLHFYGFLPGFMYLAGLTEKLYTPRKDSPDRSIPKGTLALGGRQTGIYPQESPGGWHAVGRYPFSLFEIKNHKPVQMSEGDRIRFHPINLREFKKLESTSDLVNYQKEHD